MKERDLEKLSNAEFASMLTKLRLTSDEEAEAIVEEAELLNLRAAELYKEVQKDADTNQDEFVRASRRTGK